LGLPSTVDACHSGCHVQWLSLSSPWWLASGMAIDLWLLVVVSGCRLCASNDFLAMLCGWLAPQPLPLFGDGMVVDIVLLARQWPWCYGPTGMCKLSRTQAVGDVGILSCCGLIVLCLKKAIYSLWDQEL